MGGTAAPFVAAGLSPLDSTPPTPIVCTGDGFSVLWTWSEPLQPGPINPTQFSLRVSNVIYQAYEVTAVGNTLQISGVDLEADPGPDVITYTPSTADVKDLAGNPAAACVDFPIT